MASVTLESAGREDRATIANLFQLYVHDFSEQWAGTERGELQPDGRYPAYPHLDSYWQERARWPYLILADGRLAGFVLINDVSHSGRPLDFAVAEFFVARKHRRGGVGRAAARLAIQHRPGQWEMAVSRRNTAAQAFWRGVAAELAAEGTIEESEQDDDLWNGLIVRFRVG